MKVLIVDDSLTDSEASAEILRSAGFDVVFANSPDEGEKKLDSESPDLILMDLIMPGTSGFQLTKRFSQAPKTKDIPIVILSSKSSEIDVMWGLKNGARAYCVKPVEKDALLSAINSSIKRVEK